MHNHPTPKFSVITVTYNAEAVLEDTIQSVTSQPTATWSISLWMERRKIRHSPS